MTLAAAAKAAVAETYLNTGIAPNNREEAGMSPNDGDTFGKYVASVGVSNGRIDITYGNDVNQAINAEIVTLSPHTTADDSVTWVCGNATATAGANAMGDTGGTTLDVRYLPAACR